MRPTFPPERPFGQLIYQDHIVTHSQHHYYSPIGWSRTLRSQDLSRFAAASVSARNSHVFGTIPQAEILLNIIIISRVWVRLTGNLSNMKHSHERKHNLYYLHPFHPHF